MSVFRYNPRDYFYTSPMERFIVNLLDNTFDDRYRPLQSVAPYWLNQPVLNECNIGNALGEVINEKDKFAIQVDVSHFHPKELSVSVRDRELSIEGHHKERNDHSGHGSIERHFVRKYVMPEEVQTDTIESHLSDKGVLTICATKTMIGLPAARNIPIRASPKEPEAGEKSASNGTGQ
ncbi:Hsp20/alpha crystallin family protein [Brugia pahangi]|uniref:Small heat shock protein n=1 Tax=Brugia pahangi TaxID=6280 RepID=Q17268_BRUPA|nr:small heat shock protein [Brugia pahangi]